MSKLGGLTDIRGPTARALRRSMGLSEEVEETVAVAFDIARFDPVYNAIQLTKLSFLDEGGLRSLGELTGATSIAGGDDPVFTEAKFMGSRHRVSEICKTTIHIVCDAIQSLDDPNHYGRGMPDDTELPGAEQVDPERSVALWASRNAVPRGLASTGPACRQGLTNFLLAGHADTVMNIYDRIFLPPDHCRSLDLSWLAPLLETDAEGLPWLAPLLETDAGGLPWLAPLLETDAGGPP
jgi:hypothetical protein